MIGVMKKPSCMRFVTRSRRSRKRTEAEATVMATPATKIVCNSMRNGVKAMVGEIVT